MAMLAQLGVPGSPQSSAATGRAAVQEGIAPWVIIGGIILLILLLGAWWYAKHS